MDVSIHDTDNSSANQNDDTPTGHAEELGDGMHTNCTLLNEIDLLDVFTMMDIGNIEFWGSAGVVWMTFFIIYCILFYIALLVIFCGCIYLLLHALKQSFLLRTLVYLLTLYIFWFTFSFSHGILLFISIANGSDRTLANSARTLETISLSIFVSIIIVTTCIFHPYPNSRFPLRYTVCSTLSMYLLTVLIVILSLSTSERKSSDILTVLIFFRTVMFIVSTGTVILDIIYKHYCFKLEKLLVVLWRHTILLVIAVPYFLILCSYFLYALSTVVSNKNCIEKVQLHRVVWLVLNLLLRFCEVAFSVAVLIVEARKQVVTETKSKEESKSHNNYRSRYSSSQLGPVLLYNNLINPSELSLWKSQETILETISSTTLPGEKKNVFESVGDLNTQSAQKQQVLYERAHKPCEIEIEKLSCAAAKNLYALLDRGDSEVQSSNCIKSFPMIEYPDQLHDTSRGVHLDQNIFDATDNNEIIIDGKSCIITVHLCQKLYTNIS